MGSDEGSYLSAIIEGKDGRLYVAARGGGKGQGSSGVVFALNKDGSGYTALHRFLGNYRGNDDGSEPIGLMEGSDGVLYGTTQYGGKRLDAMSDGGTIFKVNRDGSGYQVLRRFNGKDGDGSQPWGGLVEGRDGALYGTTSKDAREIYGGGTVFKLNRDSTGYRVLHVFGAVQGDGCCPRGILLAASDGAIYGTTDLCGTGRGHNGTVFKLGTDGSGYRVLHNFPDKGVDGRMPKAGLSEGTDGALYGTTETDTGAGYGIVFRLNKDGSQFRLVHRFQEKQGMSPLGLVRGGDTFLYGVTQHRGRNNAGTAFRVNEDGGGFRVLHHFSGKPVCLIRASDGLLYGLADRVGTNPEDKWKVFRLGPSQSSNFPTRTADTHQKVK